MSDESERKWLPSAWLDEIVPNMEATPDAYIHLEGEGWALRLPDNNDSRDDEVWHTKIEQGQIVGFCWTEDFGHFDLTVNEDGTFSLDRPVPKKATHFWLPFDTDTLANSVEELVKGDDWVGPTAPGSYTMGAYFWSDEVKFRFEVDADSKPRFAPSAGSN